MTYKTAIMIIVLMLGIFLLWFGYKLVFNLFFRKRKAVEGNSSTDVKKHFCPVCQSELKKGERIKSTTFFPRSAERIITIIGCRYCINGGRVRTCPVCKSVLKPEEALSAKMSITPAGNQVRIFGCPHCLAGPAGAP